MRCDFAPMRHADRSANEGGDRYAMSDLCYGGGDPDYSLTSTGEKKAHYKVAGLNPIQGELEETMRSIVRRNIPVCFIVVIRGIQEKNITHEKENPLGAAMRVPVSLVVLAWIFLVLRAR